MARIRVVIMPGPSGKEWSTCPRCVAQLVPEPVACARLSRMTARLSAARARGSITIEGGLQPTHLRSGATENEILSRPHDAALRGPVVIVPCQVQGAVNHQTR